MSIAREMAAAGPGCAVANGLLNAFETTKVKLQLYDPRIYHQSTMRGIMYQIIQEEGLVAGLITPGLSASLTRSMIYGGYRVGLYSTIRDRLLELSAASSTSSSTTTTTTTSTTATIGLRLASGMVTGAIGSLVTCPLDVVRTRMQADAGVVQNGIYMTGLRRGKHVRYPTLMTAFYNIYQSEGFVHGLYRGAMVTVTRASLLNGAQLASYDTLKRYVVTNRSDENPTLHVLCALASGVFAQSVIMPIDAIKSCMMVGNGWKTVWYNIRSYGPLWFYRGYIPAATNQGLIMVLQMPIIEQLRKLLGIDTI